MAKVIQRHLSYSKFKNLMGKRLKRAFKRSNELEKETLLKLISGFLTYDYEDYKKVKVATTHYPLLKRPISYIQIQTNFGTFNIFVRRTFYGKSGTAFHSDFLVFKNRVPEKRENPEPDAIIEVKSGKTSGTNYRNFIFQLLVEAIDFQPKVSILITERESQSEIATAHGYDGVLNSFGIKHVIEYELDSIAELLNNGINAEFTKNKIKNFLK